MSANENLSTDQRIEIARVAASLFGTVFPEFGNGRMKMSYLLEVSKNNNAVDTKELEQFQESFNWLFEVVAAKVLNANDYQ
ncbi:hypothetical protein NLN82_22755 [Citrobacter portucalensis]|uniref:hypothetical protein n=1 Tax=Citrobacter portucalensis TaxID=1639133 RepID=UPI00226B40A1|nr:hypothetical protein [Citrobacter portucalensis]MCX9038848.1 hypothetical protein [Citrobacter portucalensis]